MTKPNRALAHLAKRPFEQVNSFDAEYGYNHSSEQSAEDMRDRLKAEGFDAKMTSRALWHWEHTGSYKRKKYTGTEYVVWKREKPTT